ILDDWSADGAAELGALERVAACSEEVPRVKRVIPEELERGSVELIGAGLSGDADHRAGGVGILCAKVAFLQAELLDRVGVRKYSAVVAVGVAVHAAVHEVIDTALPAAIDYKGVTLAGAGSALDDACLNREKLRDLPAVQGKIHNPL